jgi:Tol biopolymer transport system component
LLAATVLAPLFHTGPAAAAPGDTILVSHDTGPDRTTTGEDKSEHPSISADGRYVAFQSDSDNLDGDYDNVGTEVYLSDTLTGIITLVSHLSGDPKRGAGGQSFDPWISADGNFVVFTSYATGLVVGQIDANADTDVFLWSRENDETVLVSHQAGLPDVTANGVSAGGVVSADGQHVAFTSAASNLVAGQVDPVRTGAGGQHDVFRYSLAGGAIDLVSHAVGSATTAGNHISYSPTISADGSRVAFASRASDLGGSHPARADSNPTDVFVWVGGVVSLLSHVDGDPGTAGNLGSGVPEISDDGSVVAFNSYATDLVEGTDENEDTDVFFADVATGDVRLVSHVFGDPTTSADGASHIGDGYYGNVAEQTVFAGPGQTLVAFTSDATNLAATGPTEGGLQQAYVFVENFLGAGLELVAPVSIVGDFFDFVYGNNHSYNARVSPGGNAVVFESAAGNLGFYDSNDGPEIFVFDFELGLGLASHASGSLTTAGVEGSETPFLSADGSRVAYQSWAENLVAGQTDTNDESDIFVTEPFFSPSTVEVTVTAPSPTKVVGAPIPTLTPTYTGLTDGDTQPETPATCTTTATATSPPGMYLVTCSGAADDKYTFDYVEGTLTVTKASPTLSTMASAGGPVGSTPVRDVATLAGGFNPTGNVTFRLYKAAGCTGGDLVFTSSPALSGPVATSTQDYTPLTVGTFYWTATYLGDTNNNPVGSACGALNESVKITKATPTITTQSSPNNLLGAPVRDVATLAGGYLPTGNVTFKLFSNSGCSTQVFAETATLSGLSATSDWYNPGAVGTYYWTAVYTGDPNNNSVTSPCGALNESVEIKPFTPPALTRPPITGNVVGPVTVGAGESVQITGAQVVGPVTVSPGGALTVVNSRITKGLVVSNPTFLSICNTDISGPSPGQALGVSNAAVPIRIGDPANSCAGNRFAGTVNLTAIMATTFGANTVSHATSVTNGGAGATVIKANVLYGTLACSGNNPAPTNAGQPNTGPGSKTGQCSGL